MKLPTDVTREIESALTSQFAGHIAGEQFIVSGRFEPGFLHLDVALRRRDETFAYEMQFRCALAENKLSEAESLDVTVDFVGWYLEQYFESGRDLILPLDFQPCNMGENIVYACGDIDNPMLTRMADEILERGVALDPEDRKR